MVDFKISKSISRLAAVQLMYEKEILGISTKSAFESFEKYMKQESIYSDMQPRFFRKLVAHLSDDINFNEIYNLYNVKLINDSKILDSIVRVAIVELINFKTATPIIINEYVELSKNFINENEVKFINAVLDKIANNINRNK